VGGCFGTTCVGGGAAAEALWALTLAFNPLWRALVEERAWSPDQFRAFLARLHRATFATP